MAYDRIVISSGHGKHIRGASGVLDEVDEARKVVEQVAMDLRDRGTEVVTFHDDSSHDQSTNLNTIVNFHNNQSRELDVSVHFNAYVETTKLMGVECLYVSQQQLAAQVSGAIAGVTGLPNRGAKKRTDLFFLNQTSMPSILLETCFVDSTADANVYGNTFKKICAAVADVLGGALTEEARPPEPPPVEATAATVDIQIAITGNVRVTVNGEQVDVSGHGRAPVS
jgi:N-acetylmuramoyl-L-alanine amidase